MSRPDRRARAFTLAEMLVVVLVLGLLAIFAVMQYLKTVEVTRADQAINAVQQIAAAQHMYALNVGKAVKVPAGPLDLTCNNSTPITCPNGKASDANGCCGPNNNPGAVDPCELVRCNFMAKRDWSTISYGLFALNPTDTAANWSTACGFTVPGSINGAVGCAYHRKCTACGGTTTSNCSCNTRFLNWAYVIDSSGAIYAIGGAPAEEGAITIAPPPPPSPPPH